MVRDLDLRVTIGTSFEMDRKLAHKLSLQGKAPRDALNMYDKIIKMKNIRLDAPFHTVLIDSLVEIERISGILEEFVIRSVLLDNQFSDSIQSDLIRNHPVFRISITFASILSSLCLCRDLDLRVTIGTSFEMDRKLAHKLSLQVLWRSVSISAAIRLFNRSVVEKHPLDVVSYTVAVKGLVRGRRMDEACSLLYKMKGLIGLLSLVCARREIRIG
ncbi:hypothetical protein F2Q70_00041609 [Brassica cretica]|uniref:Pentatricopeptide repeat-containing protein n=1 Tax=Brassica cretica TaxID=69181 RepID=A0A8S9KA82_BRACR|nr:hypothetical protein F2Q70_00041609 [Brassica cretica]